MTTISATMQTTGSGSPGSSSTAQNSSQSIDGQPTFSDALSQAQSRDRTAQNKDVSASASKNATSAQTSAASKTGKHKTKTDPTTNGQPGSAFQPTLAPTIGPQQNPQGRDSGKSAAESDAAGITLQSGKGLPPSGGKQAIDPPLLFTGLPQALAHSAGEGGAQSAPGGPTASAAKLIGTQQSAASDAKNLRDASSDPSAPPGLFQMAMSAANEAHSANGAQMEKLAQTLTDALTQTADRLSKDGSAVQHADATPAQSQSNTPTALLAALMPSSNAPISSSLPAAQPYTAAMHTPVGAAPWGQELGQQLLFAVNGQQQLATLHLNPPQLGPLEVHLTLHNGQIDAQFVSQHQVVRQALESAMPQLHDLFTGAGLTLMQTSVNSGGNGRGNFQNRPSSAGIQGVGAAGAQMQNTALTDAAIALQWKQGLVNTYV